MDGQFWIEKDVRLLFSSEEIRKKWRYTAKRTHLERLHFFDICYPYYVFIYIEFHEDKIRCRYSYQYIKTYMQKRWKKDPDISHSNTALACEICPRIIMLLKLWEFCMHGRGGIHKHYFLWYAGRGGIHKRYFLWYDHIWCLKTCDAFY